MSTIQNCVFLPFRIVKTICDTEIREKFNITLFDSQLGISKDQKEIII
jgi:hypothetical protein